MRSGSLTRPSPLVAFDWGSQSTSRVLTSAAAKDAARLMAVVVFPTPPFWLATAMIRPISCLKSDSYEDISSQYGECPKRGASAHWDRSGSIRGEVIGVNGVCRHVPRGTLHAPQGDQRRGLIREQWMNSGQHKPADLARNVLLGREKEQLATRSQQHFRRRKKPRLSFDGADGNERRRSMVGG